MRQPPGVRPRPSRGRPRLPAADRARCSALPLRIPPALPRARHPATTLRPSSSTAASSRRSSGGSPSAAATAPSMTRFTKLDPPLCGEPRRRHAAHRQPSSSGGVSSAFSENEPAGARPSATSASCTSDGSSTTTRSGSVDGVVAADRAVGNARERAQRRAAPLGPVLGERLDALARSQQREREHLGSGLRALAGARVPADLGQLASREAPVDRERRALSLAHGLDDARAAVDGVAAGEDAPVGRAALVVDDDLAPGDSRPPKRADSSGRGRWPIALTTVSARRWNSLPATGSGRRRPPASAGAVAPRRIQRLGHAARRGIAPAACARRT